MVEPRHFLSFSDDPARKHEIELSIEDVRALDLVPCGGFDVGEILETYWVVRGDPAGDNDYQHRNLPDNCEWDGISF
jgi:hypothetical protein